MIMEARELVAASLAGLDAGEAGRLRQGPCLSHQGPAARYTIG